MRVTREQFEENRRRIVEAAVRLFRERGFEDVGVAEIMKAAGLTHGGFYGHFQSKDDLVAQAAAEASRPVLEQWRRIADARGPDALHDLARIYLSERHLEGVGEGCVIAALGPEIARRPQARGGVTASIKAVVEVLDSVTPGASSAERRRKAIAAYASWIGALVLARVSEDPDFSSEVLEAVLQETAAAEIWDEETNLPPARLSGPGERPRESPAWTGTTPTR
jgi:TetR/AcrR family transcriptional repressor of nem operon